jgi:hypothetical protein
MKKKLEIVSMENIRKQVLLGLEVIKFGHLLIKILWEIHLKLKVILSKNP